MHRDVATPINGHETASNQAQELIIKGNQLCAKGNLAEGLQSLQLAVQLNPQNLEAHYSIIMAYARHGHYDRAMDACYNAINIIPKNALLFNTLGNLHFSQDKAEEAINHYQQAIQLNSTYAEAYYNLASVYRSKSRFNKAIRYYELAIQYKPTYLRAYHYLVVIQRKLNMHSQAIENLHKLLQLEPNNGEYALWLADGYEKTKQFKNAYETYKRALDNFPNDLKLVEGIVSTLKSCCWWDEIDYWTELYFYLIDQKLAKKEPFSCHYALWLDTTAEKKLVIAKNLAAVSFVEAEQQRKQSPFIFEPKKKAKIRLGYVSADIRNHPTSHLIMGLFSNHNSDEFETYLYSIGPRDDSIYSITIPTLANHFFDLNEYSDTEAAKKIHEDGIDVLVDMMAYTLYARTNIFALKPAPVQISYLAYPGTMGTDFIDYLVSDPISVPPEKAEFYAENLIYLPHTYFITDDKQPIATEIPTRAMCGLPEDAFIFCCFNKTAKIEPKSFDIWMRVMHEIPNSVLWIYQDSADSVMNLRKEAVKRGIAEERIIAAENLPKDKHLARIQLADLFLDCFSYSAHTTAIDALWAGVPVLTYPGDDIAARGSSSIVTAIGLPEMIAESLNHYEQLALHYAKNPDLLNNVREKLERNKKTEALFNTKRYVRNLENGFKQAWELYLNNQAPRQIIVKE